MARTPVFPLLGTSRAWCEVERTVDAVSRVPWPVRIEGPTGSGKSLVARHIHDRSGRPGAFVPCHINAMASGLELGQLVGHTRGAFTGAARDQTGAFESAHQGTLFLDEIGTATPLVQRSLLQLLDEGQVTRIGEQRARLVDVRVITATNTDLEALVEAGEFRADLYHRLGCLRIEMPALRGRASDIVGLFEHYLADRAGVAGVAVADLGPTEFDRLISYPWPGNVRELIHVAEYFVVFGDLPPKVMSFPAAPWRERVDRVLAETAGNKSAAALALGVSRKTLYDELRRRAQEG